MPVSFHAALLVGQRVTFCQFRSEMKAGGKQNAAHMVVFLLNKSWPLYAGNNTVIKNQISLPAKATSELLWHKWYIGHCYCLIPVFYLLESRIPNVIFISTYVKKILASIYVNYHYIYVLAVWSRSGLEGSIKLYLNLFCFVDVQ